MGSVTSIVSLCIILKAICIASTISDNTQKITKEWTFQFDLKNKTNWDNYQIIQNDENILNGKSNGCTSRIPVLFKKLCVNWNDNDGFAFKFKSSTNLNIDPNYDDILWYYDNHESAQIAEKTAKAKYVGLEDKELTEIAHDNDLSINLRRRLITKKSAQKCYWYGDTQACAHIDPSNKNLLTVSVGLNEEEGAEYADYGDYEDYDDLYDDEEYYDDYDMNELYGEYLQLQQALYNEQWANYLQQQQYTANAYNEYDDLYEDYDGGSISADGTDPWWLKAAKKAIKHYDGESNPWWLKAAKKALKGSTSYKKEVKEIIEAINKKVKEIEAKKASEEIKAKKAANKNQAHRKRTGRTKFGDVTLKKL